MKVATLSFLLFVLIVGTSHAFCTVGCRSVSMTMLQTAKHNDNNELESSSFFPFEEFNQLDPEQEKDHSLLMPNRMKEKSMWSSIATTTALLLFSSSSAANAAGPDWGLFEGRTGSLIHPTIMVGLFFYSAYTAFLGFQWRRQRTLGDEISSLKLQLPPPPVATEEVSPTLTAAAESIETQIKALQQERKDLAAAGPRDKHYAQGATLVFLGTAIAIEGCLNTFGRTGKLFPGPHLYVGAALVVLWALGASMVPSMQKGSETARTIHIAVNVLTVALFGWQVVSGIPILLKVIENTTWP